MRFFHVYNEHCFRGLEKNGLLNEDTGFKIQHVFSLPKEMKFNDLAAKGGKLYNLIKDGNIPFYVDRIAGGVTYHKYPFDKDLIREYNEILGDWFLGFQLHESGSNRRRAEWPRMIKVMGGKGPYDLGEMRAKMRSTSAVTPEGVYLYTASQDSLEFYSKKVYAETYQEFMEEMKELFRRRLEDTDGHILPCDSFYVATKLQDEMGMKTFMPEVGSQIPLMRQEVALARGMAKAKGKTWGTYYECWAVSPDEKCSMPCYNTDPVNEWYLTQETHTDDFTSFGKNGGSSRLLQDRIYHYALMSGADYFSEEWGLNCSYSDMDDFSLSEYGMTKKKFIGEAMGLRNVKAVVPFAIVLPKAYACMELPGIFDEVTLGKHRDTYLESPLNAEEKRYFGHVEDVLKLFFARNGQFFGNEGHVMTDSRFGDVMDILYEDAPAEALQRYEYLIDASPDGDFARAMEGKGLQILESGDLEKMAVTVEKLIPNCMPCYADKLHWLVSASEDGRRFVSLFNNEGNHRSTEHGDVIDSSADQVVTLTFKTAAQPRIVSESVMPCTIVKKDGCTYQVKVPAAGFVVLEY